MIATQSSSPPAAGLTLDPTNVQILFPEGLVGCASWKRFVLLTDSEQDLPVGILESLDEPGVRLMITDPALVMPGYSVSLSSEDREALGLGPNARPVVYCTLTIGADGMLTANLLGPLAINASSRQAKQLVLSDSWLSARHPVGVLGVTACSS